MKGAAGRTGCQQDRAVITFCFRHDRESSKKRARTGVGVGGRERHRAATGHQRCTALKNAHNPAAAVQEFLLWLPRTNCSFVKTPPRVLPLLSRTSTTPAHHTTTTTTITAAAAAATTTCQTIFVSVEPSLAWQPQPAAFFTSRVFFFLLQPSHMIDHVEGQKEGKKIKAKPCQDCEEGEGGPNELENGMFCPDAIHFVPPSPACLPACLPACSLALCLHPSTHPPPTSTPPESEKFLCWHQVSKSKGIYFRQSYCR